MDLKEYTEVGGNMDLWSSCRLQVGRVVSMVKIEKLGDGEEKALVSSEGKLTDINCTTGYTLLFRYLPRPFPQGDELTSLIRQTRARCVQPQQGYPLAGQSWNWEPIEP